MKRKIFPQHNGTEATEFVLLGLTSQSELQPILFVVFLLIYLITLTRNLGVILLIRFTPQLQTPMYFFLTHLACVDIFYSTNVSPQMLFNFLSEKKNISYTRCLAQCFVFVTLFLTEYYMLGAMAYDRYMAICKPLHYNSRMSTPRCICLVTFPYFWGSTVGTMQVILPSHLSFCGPNTINHFYCADPPLLMLTGFDTYIKQTALFVSAGIYLTGSLLIILISYVFIFNTITSIHSHEGQCKAFSTFGFVNHCATTGTPMNDLLNKAQIVVMFCIFMSPMLNLFIYSPRNKEVKQTLRRRRRVPKQSK
uniref:Olfactory receptor n=1 Tax=Sus scrofa TaxID=9823 RepID=A0A8D1FLX1_PIG